MKKYFPRKMLHFLSSAICLSEAVSNKLCVDVCEKTSELDSVCTWGRSCGTPPTLATRYHCCHTHGSNSSGRGERHFFSAVPDRKTRNVGAWVLVFPFLLMAVLDGDSQARL